MLRFPGLGKSAEAHVLRPHGFKGWRRTGARFVFRAVAQACGETMK